MKFKTINPNVQLFKLTEDRDKFIDNLVTQKWIIDNFLGSIEKVYREGAPRLTEAKELHTKTYEELRKLVQQAKLTRYEISLHNLNWLWSEKEFARLGEENATI